MQVICAINYESTYITKNDKWEKKPYLSVVGKQFIYETCIGNMYAKYFLKSKFNRTKHQILHFVRPGHEIANWWFMWCFNIF